MVADDTQLVELSAEPAQKLFPALDRKHAFNPLLATLVVLTGLYALEHRTLSDADALWGLRSLNVLAASTPQDVVIPAGVGPDDALRFQPPLGTWLSAAAMLLVGSAGPLSPVLVSAGAMLGVAGMMALLCSQTSRPVLRFWVVLILAFHAPFLAQVQDPAPHALAIFFSLGTFWGYLNHVHAGTAVVSMRLLVAGVSLGLCLLAGGPLALLVLLVLLVYTLGLVGHSRRARNRQAGRKTEVWVGWPALQSLALLSVTGFAVGGWWFLMMYSRFGNTFLHGWLTGSSHQNVAALQLEQPPSLLSLSTAATQIVGVLGVYWSLSLFGLLRACRNVYDGSDESRRQWLLFVTVWLLCAFLVFPSYVRHPAVDPGMVTLWQLFMLLPAILMAGYALEEITLRRSRLSNVFLLTVLVLITGGLLRTGLERRQLIAHPLFYVVLAATAAVGCWLHYFCRYGEQTRRIALSGMVAVQLASGVGVGIASIHRNQQDEPGLTRFHSTLKNIRRVEHCALVSEDTPPVRLVYTVRSVWPDVAVELAESWDTALERVFTDRADHARTLLIDWSLGDTRPVNFRLGGLQVQSISEPEIFQGRELRGFLLTTLDPPAVTGDHVGAKLHFTGAD